MCNHAPIGRLYHVQACSDTLSGIIGRQYGLAWLLRSPGGPTLGTKKKCLGVQYTVQASKAL